MKSTKQSPPLMHWVLPNPVERQNERALAFKKSRSKRYDACSDLELLGGFEPPTSSLPTAIRNFFKYFFLIYRNSRSVYLSFRHSSGAMFPLFPGVSAAVYVVKKGFPSAAKATK